MPLTPDRIMWLLSAFDKQQSSFFIAYYRGDPSTWLPEGDEEKSSFAELTAPENRESLKQWYARREAINPGAEAFRRILERAVGEPLPVGGLHRT
jgi:hypothetical protein